MIFLANPLEVLRVLMNNGFLIICVYKKEVRTRSYLLYIGMILCLCSKSEGNLIFSSAFHFLLRNQNSDCNKWRALWQQADAVFEFQIPSTTNEKQYGNKQMLLIEFQISSATNEEHYGNKQMLLIEFQISSTTNEEQYGNKQMLLIEFQIPSTTNEKQYGNKQTLCLNFKFRVQQMKSNMEKIFCFCSCFYP